MTSFLDAAEVGKLLKLHPVSVRKLAGEGKIPGSFKVGGAWRFSPLELARLGQPAPEQRKATAHV